MSIRTLLLVLPLAFGAVACGLPSGMHIRVASSTPAQLQAASRERRVYYDFVAGDRVPAVVGVVGVLEATSPPVAMVAKRDFSVYMERDGTMAFVFDGRRLTASEAAAQWTMLFTSAPDGTTVTGVMIGVGTEDDLD